MARHFECWRYQDKKDLDILVPNNDRDANKTDTYGIWVRDRQEADEENQNFSALHFWGKKLQVITLAERMLYELKFWDETGDHLDIENLTICAGSRPSDDYAVCMFLGSASQTVCVIFINPDYADSGWRARSEVSA